MGFSWRENRWHNVMALTWCLSLAGFAVYCACFCRGKFTFTQRIGPPLSKIPSKNFKFAVIGDSHSYRTSLRDILKKASQRECVFAIHLGDFVDYDDEIEYRYFHRKVKDLTEKFTLFLTRGNHETMAVEGGFSDNYLKWIAKPHYSFLYGKCLFVVLDDSDGRLRKKQLEHYRKVIEEFRKKHPERPVFVFMHIPPKMSGLNSANLSLSDSKRFLKLCSDYEINIVFAGDYHEYFEFKTEDTLLVVTGCGGGSFAAPSAEAHFIEVFVEDHVIKRKKIEVKRDNRLIAVLGYFFFVGVPRFRWYFFSGALLLLLWEIFYFARRKRFQK